jgi:hypothetical protein
VAVVVVRVTGLAVSREIEESIGTPSGEVSAVLEARIDDRDTDLIPVVVGVREAERADQDVLELGVITVRAVSDCAARGKDGVDGYGLDIRIGSRASRSSPWTTAVSDSSRRCSAAGVACFRTHLSLPSRGA